MFEAFGLSDPGCVRSNNEDYLIPDAPRGIFIVADGMGGANAGEYASRLSAETLYEYLLNNGQPGKLDSVDLGFAEANKAVRRAAGESPDLDGMGTTMVVARGLSGAQVEVASVGDSRAYLLSGGELSLLTEDQTWVAEVGSRLGLSEEALRRHPMRHVLTMAVGASPELRIFKHTVTVRPGDQILLCSDGLHGVVEERTIKHALDSKKPLPQKCQSLIEAAKEHGGPDNITALLIQVL
jgi:serine/threonine protein phosphatase PrpC